MGTDNTAPPTPNAPPAPDLSDLYGNTGALVAAPPTTPAGQNAPVQASMSAAPAPSLTDRVWSAVKEGIPLFNKKFEAASHTDTGTLTTGETPSMQLITPQAAMTPAEQKAHPIATGIAETAGALTTPGSVTTIAGTAGFGELPGAAKAFIPKLVSLGFSIQAIKGAYDQIPAFKAAMDRGDAAEAERIATHITLDTAMGALAGQHATEGVGTHLAETGKNFVESAKEEIPQMVNAKAPAGSTEAGKISLSDLGGTNVAEKRGPFTFGRAPGGKFTEAVDAAFDTERKEAAKAKEPEVSVTSQQSGDLHEVKAHKDGEEIGSLYSYDNEDGTRSLRSSWVDDAHRGQGHGQTMILEAAKAAERDGKTAYTSDPAGETSPDAARAWESLVKKGLATKTGGDADTAQYQIKLTPATPTAVDLGDLGGKPAEAEGDESFNFGENEKSASADKPESQRTPTNESAESAQRYNAAKGQPEINHEAPPLDVARAKTLANEMDEHTHEPNNPEVKKSYDSLIADVKDQWEHAQKDMGVKFEPSEKDPYDSYEAVKKDVEENKRMKIFTGGNPLPEDHPLAKVDPKTGLTYNTMLRGVHDLYGHIAGDNNFSEQGESGATNAHRQMMSPASVPALLNETEGQVSQYFHGKAKGGFPPQNATVVPEALANAPAKTAADWHSIAGDRAAAEPAGGIDPKTGKSESEGHGTEIMPEMRQPLDHVPTSEDFQKFHEANKDFFEAHPEARIGWDNNSNVPGGHELNVGAVGPGAERVATKLGQRAAYDIGKGEEIPTGGTGKETQFPGYSTEDRFKDLNGESPMNISTRFPSEVKKGEEVHPDRFNNSLTSDAAAIRSTPGYAEKVSDKIQETTPGFVPSEPKNPNKVLQEYANHVADNLEFVHSKISPEDVEANKKWYPEGANSRVKAIAAEHGYTPAQIAGVTTVTSPLTDWNQNIGLAERATDVWHNQQDTKFTPEMKAAAKEVASVPAMAKFKPMFKSLEGKTLAQLGDEENGLAKQAWFLRLYDEGHNSRDYHIWNPDGTSAGIAKNDSGSNRSISWSFQSHIEKAINILKDGSRNNISETIGNGHKTRNFYNNMLSPDDPRYMTMDTHAIAAAHLIPYAAEDAAPKANFGGISSKAGGMKGTYAANDEGYRVAAKRLGYDIPSRLQSVAWSKIRDVFNDTFKTEENKDAIKAIWREHEDGEITAKQAREKIWDYATRWNARAAEGVQNPGEQTKLFDAGVRGSSTEPSAAGSGSGTPAGSSVAPSVENKYTAALKAGDAAAKAKRDASMKKGIVGLSQPGK